MGVNRFLVLLGMVVLVFVVGAVLLRADKGGEIRASLVVADAMGGDTTGYLRAQSIRDFTFPDDYGPHPGYKTEWWYYTGNLESESGHHFGYQFTLFRFALTPPDSSTTERASAWATNQLYMGHFTLSDVSNKRFYAFERFSRGAAGLAGAHAAPYRLWLEDWSVEGTEGTSFPMHIRAMQDGVALNLTLTPAKPLVLQGDRGLDQKGSEPGNASYYYSFTRLATEGTLTIDGQAYAVRGLSWNDHEWSTSALGTEQVGWDWFSLQLSNDREIMFYQLRHRDGSISPFTNGLLVHPDGTTQPLSPDQVTIDVLDSWTSPRDASVYPARWRFQVPSEDLDLDITPYLADQELDVAVRYWEGAVRLRGTMAGESVSGSGYVEMTGYGEEGRRRFED